MLLRYFYDEALAHASYMVGCQRERVAIVVDPGRDIAQYLAAAKREGLKLVAAAETHIHADYVSGVRELAERFDAKLCFSDEGPAEWKYQFAANYDSQLLKDGDSFTVGRIKFDVMHTPGHTPESLSFVLTDQGGGADKPMGIFTGDFVFVGAIGRPDLLEEAAGIQGSAQEGAKDLFQSVQWFRQLPDYLQVWPAHGAGSACGKGLGAIPSTTVGYEKLFNPALQFESESDFVDYILSDQPVAPKYFATMKQVNKAGPRVLGSATTLPSLDVTELDKAKATGTLLDISASSAFAEGHVPGSLNIPQGMLAGWAGWILDYSLPVFLIGNESQVPEAVRVLHKIGVETIAGFFTIEDLQQAGRMTERYENRLPIDLVGQIERKEVTLIDVRSDAEWNAGRIEHAQHHFLGRLTEHLGEIGSDKPVVAQCLGGARSAIAASILQAAGKQVINMSGGFNGWRKARLPIETNTAIPDCKVGSGVKCSQ